MELSDPGTGTHFALIWTQFRHARFDLSPGVSVGDGGIAVAAIVGEIVDKQKLKRWWTE